MILLTLTMLSMWDRHSVCNMTPNSIIDMRAAKEVYRRRYQAEEERQARLAAERAKRQENRGSE